MQRVLTTNPPSGDVDRYEIAIANFRKEKLDKELESLRKEYGDSATVDQIYEYYLSHKFRPNWASDVDCNIKAEQMIEYLKNLNEGKV